MNDTNRDKVEPVSPGGLDARLTAMLQGAEGISDLLLVAGKPPQLEIHGRLMSFGPEPVLNSARIERLARDLTEQGSCDCSDSLGAQGRFRGNVFWQNGNFALVLRRLQSRIPTMDELQLPAGGTG